MNRAFFSPSVLLFACVVGLISGGKSATILDDTFNLSSIDSSKWEVSLPFSDSSVVVEGGEIVLNNNGQLTPKIQPTAPYSITLEGVKLSAFEVLSIAIRSDGVIAPGEEVAPGIRVNLWNQLNSGGAYFSPYGLQGGEALASGSWSRSSEYKLRVTDDGKAFSLHVNDTLAFTGNSTLSAGTKITIFNRGTQRGWAIPSSTRIGRITIEQNGPVDSDADGVGNYREGKDGTDPNDGTSFNPLSRGLVAYYPFDGNANDESGYGNNGAVVGSVSQGTDRFGSVSGAYSFDGAGTVDVPHSPLFSLSSTNAKTISVWFRPDPSSPVGHIIGKRGFQANQFNWEMSFNAVSSSFVSQSVGPLFGVFEAPGGPPLNSWVHWVGIYSNGSWSLYQDGALVSSGGGLPHPDSAVALQIGNSGGYEPFVGQIDDVRIYGRALSSNEIEQLYVTEAGNLDSDKDGVTDAVEFLLEGLGFDSKVGNNAAQILSLFNDPNDAALFTLTQYNANRTNGQFDVTTDPSAFNLFTQSQYDDFGALQFSNGVSSIVGAMPSVELSAPASTIVRAGLGTNSMTGVTASNLPPGWAFDAVSGQIHGRLSGTNPVSAMLLGQHSSGASIPMAFTFTPQPGQTITPFATIPAQRYANPQPTLTIVPPTASSGLPVTVTVKSGPATISNNVVTLTGAGRVELAANQSGTPTMAAAPEVTTFFNVAKGSQTISFGPLATEAFAPGKQIQLSATSSSGLPVTYTTRSASVISISNSTVTIVGRGRATIQATQPGNNNWNPSKAVNQMLVVY